MTKNAKLVHGSEVKRPFSMLKKDADDGRQTNSGDAAVSKIRFVALRRFVVANGIEAQVSAAFLQRPHLVDDTPGFKQWHHSHAYHASHSGISKGLKLVPGETSMSHF